MMIRQPKIHALYLWSCIK